MTTTHHFFWRVGLLFFLVLNTTNASAKLEVCSQYQGTAFSNAVNEALSCLEEDPVFRERIHHLRNVSKNSHFICPCSQRGCDESYRQGRGSIIAWQSAPPGGCGSSKNANHPACKLLANGETKENDNVYSIPIAMLGHELQHSYDIDTDNDKREIDLCSKVLTREIRGVRLENRARRLNCVGQNKLGQDPRQRNSYSGNKLCDYCGDGIYQAKFGEECDPGGQFDVIPSDSNCPGECSKDCFCSTDAPAVYFVVSGLMAHDPNLKRIYIEKEGGFLRWEASIPDASTSNSTGSALVTGTAEYGRALVDFDITYEGGGTTGLGYSGGIQAWITGEIGQRYRFKWDANWTITNQGGPNSYAEWNNRKESGELKYDKTFTIDGYNREVDIPGVGKVPYVFVFDFPRETKAGVWGIVNAFGGVVKARVEISVEFLD